jgi:hypothetical protein
VNNICLLTYLVIHKKSLKKYQYKKSYIYKMSAFPELTTDALFNILLNLPFRDLLRTCSLNKQAQQICDTNNFWYLKVTRDFGRIDNPTNIPWGLIYKDMMNITQDKIKYYSNEALARGLNVYWRVNAPFQNLDLSDAINFVQSNYPHAQGNNRFVYWPQFRVAGTVKDIFNTFSRAGINTIASSGQYMPLTEGLIATSSLDPLNPAHAQMISQM